MVEDGENALARECEFNLLNTADLITFCLK